MRILIITQASLKLFIDDDICRHMESGSSSGMHIVFAKMILIIIQTNIQLLINGVIYRHMESGSSSGRHIVMHCGIIYFL